MDGGRQAQQRGTQRPAGCVPVSASDRGVYIVFLLSSKSKNVQI